MGEARAAQELRRLLHEGQHQEILRRTLDSESGLVTASQSAAVVGALALLGRIDEALACARSAPADRALDVDETIEVAFFLVVGFCHAGRYEDAERWALRNLKQRGDARADKTWFFIHQGAALVRYFSGRMRPALHWVRRALAASVAARFNYGRLLALDLWGHTLVQLGEVSSGLRTLGQAERLASSQGYVGHATSIACSRLAYQNRHGREGADLEEALTQVAVRSTDNLYALRAAWLELSFRAAIHGDAARARECFERAEAQAVPEQDERSRTRLWLTAAILRRLDHSSAASAVCLRAADAAAERAGDRVLRAEVRCWDVVLGAHALPQDIDAARTLRRRTSSFAAQCLDALLGGASLDGLLVQGTPLWSVLLRADLSPNARALLALREGWLGLAVILLGGEPGRHIWLMDDALLANDHGTVVHAAKAPRHTLDILRALVDGEQTKEALIGRVWHMRRYSPAHHDAVIYTAIARMRRNLGVAADWVRTSALGYALAPGVAIHQWAGAEIDPMTTGDVLPEFAPPDQARPSDSHRPRQPTVEEALATASKLSSIELAQRLGVSEATALRRLRDLIREGVVRRDGAGKNTRYALT